MMINRLEFHININAEKSKIWEALWSETSYREWVGVFFKGSYAVTDGWKEGSKVHFLVPDKSGIYSVIDKHIPNAFMAFRHIGKVVNGKEQPLDDEAKKWTGATETYKIIEGEGTITLKVEIDVMGEHVEFMTNTFPKALEIVKNNCS